MAPMDPLVVAVVLNWNQPEETADCVASLLASDYRRLQTLVVDNGSTDNSVSQLRGRFGDQIRIVETGTNLYYAGGNNIGLKWALEAGATWALILNNDTVVGPELVSTLVQAGADDSCIGVLAPMIYYADDRLRIWALGSRRHPWLPMPRDIGRGEIDRGQYTAPFAVDYVTGCAMMLRQTVLTQVGFFDRSYRMYFEDADLCARAQRAGFGLRVEPRAKMWHRVSLTSKRQASTTQYQKTRYRVRFYRQHPHGPLKGLTHAVLCLQEFTRCGAALMRGQRSLAQAGLRGLRDGYREKIEKHIGSQ